MSTNNNESSEPTLSAAAASKKARKDAEKAEKLAKFQAKKGKEIQKPEKKPNVETSSRNDFQDERYTRETRMGHKKDVSEFPKSYSPLYVEAAWYSWWEKQGYFKPEFEDSVLASRHLVRGESQRGQFVMVIPPPNVTGYLHLGHALTNAIEDAFTRWHRQRGDVTLWVPGCDHAGIATQVVVEKRLKRERGITRHDLGREAFVEEVWKWKMEKGDTIYNQLRCMGISCDWDRQCFTMDPGPQRAVAECFIRLHRQGFIYRTERLVNWSCSLRSAISDIEVDKRELPAPRTRLPVPGYAQPVEFGVLHRFAYPLLAASESGDSHELDPSGACLEVATTRLETMLGDVAVAVHPDDKRYSQWVGRRLRHPFYPEREMRVVADTYVDPEFGTGAVKITPAHDPNDFDLGKRHNLPMINILDDSGNISLPGQFFGQPRFDARKNVELALTELGLFRDKLDNPNMVVPVCSRSKDILEPRLKPQWYVRCDEFARRAVEAVREGKLKILPRDHEKIWFSWLENVRDWCISRQLWWGHRSPAYLLKAVRSEDDVKGDWKEIGDAGSEQWFSAHSLEEAAEQCLQQLYPKLRADHPECPATDLVRLEQDPDVLDTWFSSAFFPFSTMGWPDTDSNDFKRFYPNSILETGWDILFFWVARMVMMGLAITDQLPFHTVYLHAIIRDAHGKKMSKSTGNALDPLDVINGISLADLQEKLKTGNLEPSELKRATDAQSKDFPKGIPVCGTDALRFELCRYSSQVQAINLDVLRIRGSRCFCNKVWQACRYLLQFALPNPVEPDTVCSVQDLANHLAELRCVDRWILGRLAAVVEQCDAGFNAYDLSAVTQSLYEFWLYEFCDCYLEYSKAVIKPDDSQTKGSASTFDSSHASLVKRILWLCAITGLALLHPFMPFLTEELYQQFRTRAVSSATHCNLPESVSILPYPEPAEWRAYDFSSLSSASNGSGSSDMAVTQSLLRPLIQALRSCRTANDIPVSEWMDFHMLLSDSATDPDVESLRKLLMEPSCLAAQSQLTRCRLLGVVRADATACSQRSHLTLPFSAPAWNCGPAGVTMRLQLYIDGGSINCAKLLSSVSSKQEKLNLLLRKLNAEIAQPGYVERVLPSVRDANSERLAELQETLSQLQCTAESLQQQRHQREQDSSASRTSNFAAVLSAVLVALGESEEGVARVLEARLRGGETGLAACVWLSLVRMFGGVPFSYEYYLELQWLNWCELKLLPFCECYRENDNYLLKAFASTLEELDCYLMKTVTSRNLKKSTVLAIAVVASTVLKEYARIFKFHDFLSKFKHIVKSIGQLGHD